jgi:hypothetical protein
MDIVAIDFGHGRSSRGGLARGAAMPVERVVEGEVLDGRSDSEASWSRYRQTRETLNAVPDPGARRALAVYLATSAASSRPGLIDIFV